MKNITKIAYRPEIDGLRAIAILSVILYHANLSFYGFKLSGGYLGVDIFFVISGYLISKIIFKELNSTGNFDYLYFLERRARRLLPACFLMIGICFLPGYFLLLPQFFENFALSAISAVFFSSNIYFHYSGLLYGAESGLLKPLLHTWSLSIEEQFYFFFSLFILFFFQFLHRSFNLLLILFFLISLLFSLWASEHHISFNFYMIFSRAWEFLLGIFIAHNEDKLKKFFINPVINNFIIYLSFITILFSFFYFENGTKHPSLLTLPLVISTGILILCFNNEYKYKFLLNNRASIFFGKVSYSLYIWHFPIFSFYRISNNNFDNNITEISFFIILLVIFISYLSYEFVEKSFRNKQKYKINKFIKVLLVKFTLVLFISTFVFFNKGIDGRLPESLKLRTIDDRIVYLEESIKCHKKFRNKDTFCKYNEGKKDKIFILGDSQLETFVYSFKRLNELKNFEIIQMTRPGCYLGRTDDYRGICSFEHHNKRINLIKKYPGSIVIVGGSLSHYIKIKAFDEQYFKKTINELIKNNYKIIFVHPLPNFQVNVRQKIANYQLFNKSDNNYKFPIIEINKNIYLYNNFEADKILQSIKNKNIFYLHPKKIFCDKYLKEKCTANDYSKLFFVDSNHLSREGNKLINFELIKIINTIKVSD